MVALMPPSLQPVTRAVFIFFGTVVDMAAVKVSRGSQQSGNREGDEVGMRVMGGKVREGRIQDTLTVDSG